jgi:ADP-ribose pyrophosphatase YjhB (NUDIX family)
MRMSLYSLPPRSQVTFILCNAPIVWSNPGSLYAMMSATQLLQKRKGCATLSWRQTNAGTPTMKYCPECGTLLEARWISTEGRERLVCASCTAIRYENPRILVALMLTCGDRLLLCRRAHQPSLGTWTPPSGFMERGETLEGAAARETFEEAGVQIDPEKLLLYEVSSLSLPTISEVYVVFRAVIENDSCRPGTESLAVGFFNEQDVPWNQLAYAEMPNFLRVFFREHREQKFGIHLSRIEEHGRFHRQYGLVIPP